MEAENRSKNMDPVASIIITTYNRPELFKRALKSAQAQTFKDYEIIVVDDSSERAYDFPGSNWLLANNVKWIIHKDNRGLSAARNTGIKAAKGKYIVCLDDDNELMPDYLKQTIRAIETPWPERYMAASVGRKIVYKHFEDVAYPKLGPFTAIDWGWLIRREVFGIIQYDEDLRANEDTDFGIQFHKIWGDQVFGVNMVLATAYDTENSLSFPDARELIGMSRFFRKNLHEYRDYPDEKRVLYRTMGRKWYRGGHKKTGIYYFQKSFWAKPGLNSFLNLFFILFGWYTYDKFMTITERVGAWQRTR